MVFSETVPVFIWLIKDRQDVEVCLLLHLCPYVCKKFLHMHVLCSITHSWYPLYSRDKCLPLCLHLPVCILYYVHAHTGTAWGAQLHVCDLSGLAWCCSDEWRAKGSAAARTHGDSPSTLSATTPLAPRICLCVQQQPGKSLTCRPFGFLSATDQRARLSACFLPGILTKQSLHLELHHK